MRQLAKRCSVCGRSGIKIKNPFAEWPLCNSCHTEYYRLRRLSPAKFSECCDAVVRRSRVLYAVRHGVAFMHCFPDEL